MTINAFELSTIFKNIGFNSELSSQLSEIADARMTPVNKDDDTGPVTINGSHESYTLIRALSLVNERNTDLLSYASKTASQTVREGSPISISDGQINLFAEFSPGRAKSLLKQEAQLTTDTNERNVLIAAARQIENNFNL